MQNLEYFYATIICGCAWGVALHKAQIGNTAPWWLWVFLVLMTAFCLWMPALDRSAERLGDRVGLWMHHRNRRDK